jgi:hypothetical protein
MQRKLNKLRPPKPRRPREPEPAPLPTVHDVRGVIIKVKGERWLIKSDDGRLFGVEIGDIEMQKTNLPLMLPGATVEFDIVDGFIPSNVWVAEC